MMKKHLQSVKLRQFEYGKEKARSQARIIQTNERAVYGSQFANLGSSYTPDLRLKKGDRLNITGVTEDEFL